ncbi:retrovirus-related pol polyprotein from transposon TNT 1-94 [Tanacetum coccineum]
MPLTSQPHSPKERPGLGIMKHTKPKTQDSLYKSVSRTVIVSETEPTTLLVPTEVKNTEQELKINELTKLVQMILYCMICKREDHKTSDHKMYTASLKRSENYKAQPYQYASPSKKILKAKAKTFPPCTHYGFNDHRPDNYRNYPDVIHVEALYTPPLTTMNLITSKERRIKEPSWFLDSRCSRSMTGVKSYLHKYVEQLGLKVVFGDNSSCITEGYGSINYGGIIFTKVAFVNGLKYNLIRISQLSDAKYIVQFDDKQGTILNANKEIVLIAHKRNDVYVLDISSLTPNRACFFAKASKNSKDKPCSACEKGKHHRASFKTKQNFSIRKCLHLLHMDLFRLVRPMSINHKKYILVIVDEYSRCLVFIHNLKDHLGKFDDKADDGYFLRYSFSMEAIRFTNTPPDAIRDDDSSRYPPDEFLHKDDPSRQYQNEQITTQPTEGPSENNTKILVSINKSSVSDVPQSHISNKASTSSHPAPQDRWSKDQHIELVNIIGDPGEGILTRSMVAKLIATSARDVLLVQVYVDDKIFGSTSYKLCKQFEKLMTKKFKMSMMGELTYFFGVQIKQDDKGISICQEQYTRNLLKKYEIFDSSSVKTPMVPPNNLGPDLAGKPVNKTSYKGMIGSLMYLTATRTDIQFSTVLCARYQSNPKESHITGVKRIIGYLKGTPTLGLYYPKCLGFDLKGYSDYASCNMERKSTLGACQILDGKLMVPIFFNNTSAIAISNNPVLHSRTNNIDIRYHFIRDHILKGDIELHFIPTKYQLADIFTKPLDEPTFIRLKAELGMLNID